MFFDDIMTEARTLIYAQNSIYTADNASNCAANDGADRAQHPARLLAHHVRRRRVRPERMPKVEQ